ncbi:MAG: 4Fe-4S binding protein [Bacilli bacterium]
MYAKRNIKQCTKDCLCLFVCPTGAADTENGIIDKDKCNGCGKCALSCPSHAITMVPRVYPKQQIKEENTKNAMLKLARSKSKQEMIALDLLKNETNPSARKFLSAISKSNKIMAEDIYREAGFMLPQSKNTNEFLSDLLKDNDENLPRNTIKELLDIIQVND